LRLLADPRVLWTLEKLARDPDERVRANTAWLTANIHLPFAALQRYVALAAYALKGLTTRA
jgi:hypothetical protein